jgi:hypothetical protein
LASCRNDGCANPRRVRRGIVEPLCEDCYQRAREKVARELAEEAATDGRTRFRKMKLAAGERPPDRGPERVAPVARAGARPLGAAPSSPPRRRETAAGTRTRCISEELLHEARRLYGLGLSMRAVAETLLDQTRYASANSAEVALRFQFKRQPAVLFTGVLEPLAQRELAGAFAGGDLAGSAELEGAQPLDWQEGGGGSDERAVVLSVDRRRPDRRQRPGFVFGGASFDAGGDVQADEVHHLRGQRLAQRRAIATGAFLVVVSVRATAAAVGALPSGPRSPRGVRRRGGRRQSGGNGHRP